MITPQHRNEVICILYKKDFDGYYCLEFAINVYQAILSKFCVTQLRY